MPEWKNEIKERLAGLKLEPTREAEIVQELSQHLDDRYAESLSRSAATEVGYRSALEELSEEMRFSGNCHVWSGISRKNQSRSEPIGGQI
jgi:hypothetical protein